MPTGNIFFLKMNISMNDKTNCQNYALDFLPKKETINIES